MLKIVSLVLELPDGRLVLHRRDDKAPSSPGMLGLFGGGIEEEEEPLSAAKRELAEETSLNVKSLDFQALPALDYQSDDWGQVKFHIYKIKISSEEFKTYEGVGPEAYTMNELIKRSDLAGSTKAILGVLSDGK